MRNNLVGEIGKNHFDTKEKSNHEQPMIALFFSQLC